MTTETPGELSGDERAEFLGTGGTGVISFSSDGDGAPHAVPVSYGYDTAAETFYFRLATGPESGKGDLPGRPVSFVTYGETDGGWRSVVAEGRLERTTDADVATETLAGLERVDIPYVDVFERDLRDVDFDFFRLEPEKLTGRKGQ